MKECLALFEPVLSELVKNMLTLQLLVLCCSSVSPFSSSMWGSGQHLEGWFPVVHTADQLHVFLVCLWHVLSVAVLISALFYSDELLRAGFVSEPAASFMSILPVCLKWQVYILLYNEPSNNFFPFIFISWRLITLQYYSGFCHTLTWISHGFTCISHPDPPSQFFFFLISRNLVNFFKLSLRFNFDS